jgi:hypothetical protein
MTALAPQDSQPFTERSIDPLNEGGIPLYILKPASSSSFLSASSSFSSRML